MNEHFIGGLFAGVAIVSIIWAIVDGSKSITNLESEDEE